MKYKVISVEREVPGMHRALLEKKVGWFMWRRHERLEAISTDEGVTWEWRTGVPGFIWPSQLDVDLRAVVSRMNRLKLHSWSNHPDYNNIYWPQKGQK